MSYIFLETKSCTSKNLRLKLSGFTNLGTNLLVLLFFAQRKETLILHFKLGMKLGYMRDELSS